MSVQKPGLKKLFDYNYYLLHGFGDPGLHIRLYWVCSYAIIGIVGYVKHLSTILTNLFAIVSWVILILVLRTIIK